MSTGSGGGGAVGAREGAAAAGADDEGVVEAGLLELDQLDQGADLAGAEDEAEGALLAVAKRELEGVARVELELVDVEQTRVLLVHRGFADLAQHDVIVAAVPDISGNRDDVLATLFSAAGGIGS